MFDFTTPRRVSGRYGARVLTASLFTTILSLSAPAHSGALRVIVDDFNGSVLPSLGLAFGASTTISLLSNPDGRSPAVTAGPSAGVFAIDVASNVQAEVLLNYGAVTLPTGYSSATVSYNVTFSNLGNDPTVPSGQSVANTIRVGTAPASTFGSLPNSLNPAGQLGTANFTGGNLSLLFTGHGSRAWDMSIDNLELVIQCAGVADATYQMSGTRSAPVSGLADFLANGPRSCSSVPLPSGIVLVGLGLALLPRARSLKKRLG